MPLTCGLDTQRNTLLFLCMNTFLLNTKEDMGTGVCLSAVAPMSSLQEMSSLGRERRALLQQPPHASSQALNVPPER